MLLAVATTYTGHERSESHFRKMPNAALGGAAVHLAADAAEALLDLVELQHARAEAFEQADRVAHVALGLADPLGHEAADIHLDQRQVQVAGDAQAHLRLAAAGDADQQQAAGELDAELAGLGPEARLVQLDVAFDVLPAADEVQAAPGGSR
jgi:hypothetical protein